MNFRSLNLVHLDLTSLQSKFLTNLKYIINELIHIQNHSLCRRPIARRD
ncbi:Protein CBG27182 [Caenorhabditis briggsae]|uniref:Protein CBG27182 n=1 Tax=Caenorhabditis briggsae TaxID=6238 RepID=B6IL92_CAEBR|nr:Protein CBG27182 [Caenorhabditis briggsae]CAS00645.1 Protein CBG27182 [Caenorhabditis briggsae]